MRRQKKQHLQELMNHPHIANIPIKFAYFGSYIKSNSLTGKCRHVQLTAVSILTGSDPEFAHVAFAFCSHKDSYCKTEGKIIALQRLVHSDPRFCKCVPHHGDGHVAMAEAYKLIDKKDLPVDFKDLKFQINVELS
jgi:hypothetical protein